MTFPGERSNSCRSAAPGSILPPQRTWGAWPAQRHLPGTPFGCCCSTRSHPMLPKVSLVSFYFKFFSVKIILILFCLYNPDCYHPTNYSHIFLQTANGRDKTAAGLCDFCLSNYCNYLKNGLKWYGVMNLIMSCSGALCCMWLANGQVYEKLFIKRQQTGLQHTPCKERLRHLHTTARRGRGTLCTN